ncbi:MAG: heme-binding protein [Pseudotabrizicola sp.]|uniref:GlcG/HbpS family heme-binding protein n=1 Tax=Pseudotabrizicola sp. TaxID=2939647 RepID=UPI00271E01C2|nr:heme-binding protein [Pseudotabrizicola sp.]MDO8883388.1 heme-binding protein [Pseudotabrizicola sp.]MDP2080907.1 heme-binding protein [Pseudotabrizicola sp.]MDZ7572691.1 heme-binding protein [Pseudotabrizicola sp.]
MSISIKKARTIIKTTLAKGREAGMKPLSVVVVDAGGHTIAFEREDGAAPGRYALAHGKAHGCIMLGLPGSAIQARADSQAYFVQAMNGLYGGDFVPVKGGVLVRDAKGNTLGAVGVTGDSSDNDALAATAGIEAAGLIAEA